MVPLAAAAILGGAQLATYLGSTIASNAQTGNTGRIRRLKGSQAAGELSPEGQIMADAGRGQELQALAEANRSTEAALGQMGATSGRDIAVVAQEKQRAAREAGDRYVDRWRQTFAGEGQELEDRKAIRRDRTNKAVTGALEIATGAVAPTGALAGLTQKGPSGGPDWKAVETSAGADVTAALRTAYEKVPYRKFVKLAEDEFGLDLADLEALGLVEG